MAIYCLMCEAAKNLSREEIEVVASTLKILMWECPRENGRLVLRPAFLFRRAWPSVIKAQLMALEGIIEPSVLGVTLEERNKSIEELKKVYKTACDQFMANVLVA